MLSSEAQSQFKCIYVYNIRICIYTYISEFYLKMSFVNHKLSILLHKLILSSPLIYNNLQSQYFQSYINCKNQFHRIYYHHQHWKVSASIIFLFKEKKNNKINNHISHTHTKKTLISFHFIEKSITILI